jgi:hypothetical protein
MRGAAWWRRLCQHQCQALWRRDSIKDQVVLIIIIVIIIIIAPAHV